MTTKRSAHVHADDVHRGFANAATILRDAEHREGTRAWLEIEKNRIWVAATDTYRFVRTAILEGPSGLKPCQIVISDPALVAAAALRCLGARIQVEPGWVTLWPDELPGSGSVPEYPLAAVQTQDIEPVRYRTLLDEVATDRASRHPPLFDPTYLATLAALKAPDQDSWHAKFTGLDKPAIFWTGAADPRGADVAFMLMPRRA